jgi:hypothetical protein
VWFWRDFLVLGKKAHIPPLHRVNNIKVPLASVEEATKVPFDQVQDPTGVGESPVVPP